MVLETPKPAGEEHGVRRGVIQNDDIIITIYLCNGVLYAADMSPLGGILPPRLSASGFPIRFAAVSPEHRVYTLCLDISPFQGSTVECNGITGKYR